MDTIGHRRFREWVEAETVKDPRARTRLASTDVLDCDSSTISNLVRGTRTPGRALAARIAAATASLEGGPISAAQWDEPAAAAAQTPGPERAA